jgi:two-component system, NarL family, sensor histidine kinase DegS
MGGRRLERHHEIGVFRILQEALNNISRHSHAQHVDIGVDVDGSTLTATVHDDGVGFTPRASDDPMVGVGIGGMHERAELLGAQLTIESALGKGTTVRLQVDLGFDTGVRG